MDDVVLEGELEQRKDTKILELVAEHFVSHTLGRHDILCAKPYFDQMGTDLLGIKQFPDTAKFCRIQCKGRTVTDKRNHIDIHIEYVASDFVVFLFVEDGRFEDSNLYCFFHDEIRAWGAYPKKKPTHYVLYLKQEGAFKEDLKEFKFGAERAARLTKLIEGVDLNELFKSLRTALHSYPDMRGPRPAEARRQE